MANGYRIIYSHYFIALGMCLSFVGCVDTKDDPSGKVLCSQEPESIFVSAADVDLELRTNPDGSVFTGIGVQALRGCEELGGPLAAMNWWTMRDSETGEAYNNAVGPLVFELGAKVIFSETDNTVLVQPETELADGSPWVQETLTMPLYPSAEAFAQMITSKEWLTVGGYKLNETKGVDYDFVFQKCFYGCEVIQASQGFLTAPMGPMWVHHLNATQTEVRDAIEPLRLALEEGSWGRLYFVGYSWALPVGKNDDGGETQFTRNGFWNDATFLISVPEGMDYQKILDLPAYKAFLNIASNNTIVVFE